MDPLVSMECFSATKLFFFFVYLFVWVFFLGGGGGVTYILLRSERGRLSMKHTVSDVHCEHEILGVGLRGAGVRGGRGLLGSGVVGVRDGEGGGDQSEARVWWGSEG